MGSIRFGVRGRALAAGLALALAPSAALAASHEASAGEAEAEPAKEEVRWDQERVTDIAQQLAEAMGELKSALQAQPASLDPARQRAVYAAREDVRLLTSSARHLAARLEAGDDRLETYPIYKRIGMLRRSAEENGRKALIENALMARITRAGELLLRIAPYYRDLEPVSEMEEMDEMEEMEEPEAGAGGGAS